MRRRVAGITWTIEPWKQLSEQTLCANRNGISRAGYSLITRDGTYILIDNIQNGVDAYLLPSAQHIATFHAPLSTHKPRHIAIDDSTSIVIHGSDKGIVYVHDFSTAAPIQTMIHSKEREFVQAVTIYSQGGRSSIASGGTCDHPVIMIWKQHTSYDRVKSVVRVILSLACVGGAILYIIFPRISNTLNVRDNVIQAQ
ncbi:hypothetical protein M422DRAFT_56572 [Sphaerobolus stellatus SS14]|uniref:Uncharacterized protein n=1 Tax=Sphaerobolus stellatus (strain SS14) TaxID=990650 RepID=A0A0C9UFS1_SPHS4|nr:hypothetical protein M422DRAFT_56572 [Sphaerobolus stellatus SS14]